MFNQCPSHTTIVDMQAESAQTQRMVLITGVVVTLLALVVAQFVRRADPRRYQRLSGMVSPRQ